MKISYAYILLLIATITSSQPAAFDYKCYACKWTAQLIIDYHDHGAQPKILFKLLSTLCSFLGGQDRVSLYNLHFLNTF